MAAALMLATSRLLASTGRHEFGRGALAGVERAFRAEQVARSVGRGSRRGAKGGVRVLSGYGASRLGNLRRLVRRAISIPSCSEMVNVWSCCAIHVAAAVGDAKKWT